jgi:hypothetical protein
MKIEHRLLASRAFLVLLGFSLPVGCQEVWMSDRDVMQDLRANGARYDRDSATLYFEKDGLTADDMDVFSNLVNRGVQDIEKVLNIPEEKRRSQTGTIFYFISSRIDIGRARNRSVFLPLWRVQRKVAPYLHETTHILARCNECPMWFSEGFASWMQSYVSENVGGYDANVFARRGNRGVDVEAARWLTTPNGEAVLPFVLEGGEPPDIVAERRAVGEPFYVLSQSLVKYLVDKAGIAKISSLVNSDDFNRELESVTGKTSGELKEVWLAAIHKLNG